MVAGCRSGDWKGSRQSSAGGGNGDAIGSGGRGGRRARRAGRRGEAEPDASRLRPRQPLRVQARSQEAGEGGVQAG